MGPVPVTNSTSQVFYLCGSPATRELWNGARARHEAAEFRLFNRKSVGDS